MTLTLITLAALAGVVAGYCWGMADLRWMIDDTLRGGERYE